MNSKVIDLRSDTVTKPSPEMRRAMMEAEVGDDVYIEDPTVNKLEDMAADIMGHEAALYFPTGSMANQTAINIHTHHGNEVICEEQGHIYNYEMATMSAVSGVLPRPIVGIEGFLTVEQVLENIRPKIYYRSQTGLISLENTHNLRGGKVHRPEKFLPIIEACRERNIPVHLDGARLFNAATALGLDVKELSQSFDSVMFCLSKGLGAPIGSMLCSTRSFIDRARAVRKMFGGGMRQVGILAQAGIYALENNIPKLANDHARAKRLAAALAEIPYIRINPDEIETNILVFSIDTSVMSAFDFSAGLKEEGILCGAFSKSMMRMVTHLDISDENLDQAIGVLRNKFMT
jgi:threonine aldolase